ncbi:MAG: T9SS type A sorting domain-containing protein [Chitinivibrionales bacterium]|nr:T9SS type A sorting domain-containing protein [Chitinivibrionales bacterium]
MDQLRRPSPGHRHKGATTIIVWGSLLFGVYAQTAEDFGFARLEATGTRPLLVVLLEAHPAEGKPGLAHPQAYYDSLVFGPGFPNLVDYFDEVSQGNFTFTRAGIVGPLQNPDSGTTLGDRRDRTVKQLAAADGFDFSRYDTEPRDGRVEPHELSILLIDDYSAGLGQTQDRTACTSVAAGGSPEVEVCSGVAAAGHVSRFDNIVHEVSHLLNTRDLYGPVCRNTGLTLMHCTAFGDPGSPMADATTSVHLDPWHRIQLGWVRPDIRAMPLPAECRTLDALPGFGPRRPLILYDPSRGTNEYFILELRNPSRYDRDVAGMGVVVWYVQTESDKRLKYVAAEIRPDGPSDDDDGTLHSTPAGDDVLVGDRIRPGPDGILQTIPPNGSDGKPLDGTATDALNFAVAPGYPNAPTDFASRGVGDVWVNGDGEVHLQWLDGTPTGAHVLVGPYVGTDVRRVDLNARRMELANDFLPVETGDTITLHGHFGFPDNRIVRIRRGPAGGTLTDLEILQWRCEEIEARIPGSVPTGDDYVIFVHDSALKISSNVKPLEIKETLHWVGTYSGQLDGSEAEIEVRISGEIPTYVLEVKDLGSDVTYIGAGDAVFVGDRIMEDVDLRSSEGQTLTIGTLFLHTWNNDHLSGWTESGGDNFGFAFSTSGVVATESTGEPLAPADDATWIAQWEGTFRGRIDGRDARITITNTGSLGTGAATYEVVLEDLNRDETFTGDGSVLGGAHHEMNFGSPLESETGATKRLVRLYLHTRQADYLTGFTSWNGELFGSYFSRGTGPTAVAEAEQVGDAFSRSEPVSLALRPGRLTSTLPDGVTGSVSLLDARGRQIVRRAGNHTVSIQTAGLSAGLYTVVIEGGGERIVRPLIVSSGGVAAMPALAAGK